MFRIQSVAHRHLRGLPDQDDAPWSPLLGEYESRDLAEVEVEWLMVGDEENAYRVVEAQP